MRNITRLELLWNYPGGSMLNAAVLSIISFKSVTASKLPLSVCWSLFLSLSVRLLFLKIKAHNEKEDFAFCSVKGCERVKIKALIPPGSGPSDCMAEAYPRYTEMPVVDVPMPKKLPRSKLVRRHFWLYKASVFEVRRDAAGRRWDVPAGCLMLGRWCIKKQNSWSFVSVAGVWLSPAG